MQFTLFPKLFITFRSISLKLKPSCLIWLNVFNADVSPKRYWLGPRSQEGVGREWEGMRSRLYQTLRCHHQNDFCMNMGGDESYFNVSLIGRGKVTKTVSMKHNF